MQSARIWWRRVRGWWLLTAAAASVAALTASAQLFTGAAGAVVLAVGGAVAAVFSERGRTALAQEGLPGRGDAVRQSRVDRIVDPVVFGVHPAGSRLLDDGRVDRVPPFIVRECFHETVEALSVGGFVLIVGDSAAGKTRLAFEAMRTCLPRSVCVAPVNPPAVGPAIAVAKAARPSVLWLDDLERFLQPGGLSDAHVTDLLAHGTEGVIVLATMRASERAQFSARYDSGREYGEQERARSGRAVFTQVTREIRLSRLWSAEELGRAQELAFDPRIAQALSAGDAHGLAEYLAAGPQLVQDFRDAKASLGSTAGPGRLLRGGPRGAALVSAAIDARRCGQHRPIRLELLQEMHEHYLRVWGVTALRPEPWDTAVDWAMLPLHGTSSLLELSDEGLLAFDYLVDAPGAEPVPTATWDAVIQHAASGDLVEIAWRALHCGRVAQVEAALMRAMAARDYVTAAELAGYLGDAGQEHQAVDVLTEIISHAEIENTLPIDQRLLFQTMLAWHLGSKTPGNGNPSRARGIAEQVVRDATAALGPTHPTTLDAKQIWTRQVGHDGEPELALQLARQTESDAAAALGPDHPLTQRSRFELAVWMRRNHSPREGATVLEDLVEWARHEPQPSGMMVDCLWNLSGCLTDLADHEKAQEICREALLRAKEVYGERHLRALEVGLTYADCLASTGDAGAAAALDEELARDCAESIGESHPLTRRARQQLRRHQASA